MKAKISGMVVAGFPSPAEQYQEPLGLRLPSKTNAFSADMLDLNELLVKRPAATYFVRVEGDSMVGAGIRDGDLLVVDRSLRPVDGDVIIASVEISPERSEHCEATSLEGCDFTVKTYRRDKSGVRLEPANDAYTVIRTREPRHRRAGTMGETPRQAEIDQSQSSPHWPSVLLAHSAIFAS